jgi:hypothetical protein
MKKVFTEEELGNMIEIGRITASERYKANLFRDNTAELNNPNELGEGKKIADQQEKIAKLMERARDEYMMTKLREKGYENGQNITVNLKTGEITMLPK